MYWVVILPTIVKSWIPPQITLPISPLGLDLLTNLIQQCVWSTPTCICWEVLVKVIANGSKSIPPQQTHGLSCQIYSIKWIVNFLVLFEKTPFEFILKRVNSKSHIRWDTRSRDIAKRSHEVGTLIDTIHGHATIKVGLYIITVYHLCSHDISIISFSNTKSHRHFGIPPSRY